MISGPAYGAVDERWEQLEMDIEAINEMFEGLGPVTVKRMFGGQGVYHQGRIIALEVDGEMLLKADKPSGLTQARIGPSKCPIGPFLTAQWMIRTK